MLLTESLKHLHHSDSVSGSDIGFVWNVGDNFTDNGDNIDDIQYTTSGHALSDSQ